MSTLNRSGTMTTPSPTPQTNGKSSGLFSTLGKKKKLKEAEEVQGIIEEGKQGIDGNEQHPVFDTSPENFILAENEERSMIEPGMINNYDYQELLKILINWINDELSDNRIIVKDLTEDLYDGQILGKLIEKLSGQKLAVVEVTQNEDFQRAKLKLVLDTINRCLNLTNVHVRWTDQGIHNKNTVEIIHLLVTLIRHYRAPIRLPPNVQISILIVQKKQGQLVRRIETETLTESYDDLSKRAEPRDAFDSIFDHTPDRIPMIKQSVAHFISTHLSRINIECSPPGDIDPHQFSDGLNIIFLIGMLEGYFVPLGNIYTTALVDPIAEAVGTKESAFKSDNYIESSPHNKLHNVNVALQLLEDAGINLKNKVRAEDIVQADLKATLRVLFMIFSKYKNFRY